MNKQMNLVTKHPSLWEGLGRLFPLLFLFLSSLTTRAEECTLEKTYNYTVMLEGTNNLRIKFPAYSKTRVDCWIVRGIISIKIDGTDDVQTLFDCEMQQDIDDDDYTPYIWCFKGVDGNMSLFRDQGYSTVSVTQSQEKLILPCKSSTDPDAFVNLLWDIPNKYRGKKVVISWSIHHDGNSGESDKYISIDKSSITIPEAPIKQEPMLMTPIISYDKGRPNKVMVPYMVPTSNIQSVTAYYTEVHGASTANKSKSLGTQSSDFIWLDAERPVRDLYIVAAYIDSENKPDTTSSAKIDVPILHQPYALTASLQPDGQVVVSWSIANRHWQEVMSNDSWEVQRNATGSSDYDDAGWMTIGQMGFDEKGSQYSFTDERFLQEYKGLPVFYRVRRSITALWGWSPQSGCAVTSLFKAATPLRLPTIAEATAHRTGTWSNSSHGVTLDFRLGAPNQFDSEGRFILRNAADWSAFINLVQEAKGERDVNAILCADIGVKVMVGDAESAPYRGTFDGNGHSLILDINDSTRQNAAPFRYVASASFRNLHVAGTSRTAIKHAAGLIGYILPNATVKVERCRSTVTLISSVDDDSDVGGFVGHAGYCQQLSFSDCLFDGCFVGEKNKRNAGFVGWMWNHGQVDIVNCLFAPTRIETDFSECRTWARISDEAYNRLSLKNSYCTVAYEPSAESTDLSPSELLSKLGTAWSMEGKQVVPAMVVSEVPDHSMLLWDHRAKLVLNTEKTADSTAFYIYNATDWATFVNKVNSASKDECVDAVLCADITISEPVAERAYYRGTFNGNGHTITANISNGSRTAPFWQVGNATIKNLNVSGALHGDYIVSGLVGYVNLRSSLTIENCRVSAEITVNGTGYAGGFVGKRSDLSYGAVVRNCLFDGSFSVGEKGEYNYGCAFVADNSSISIENCLDNGVYNTIIDTRIGTNVWTYLPYEWVTYNRVGDMSPDELVSALGSSEWMVDVNGAVVPIQRSTARYVERRELSDEVRQEDQLRVEISSPCLDHNFRFVVEQGDSPLPCLDGRGAYAQKTDEFSLRAYRFDNNALLTSLKADTLQDAVSLTWTTDGGSVDFFRILRCDKLTPDRVETLAAEYAQTSFIDRTVRPQHVYVYTIEGVSQCEGEFISSVSTVGCCAPTGMVRGYVRLANGIGLPNVLVTAVPEKDTEGNAAECLTDSTGFYEIGGLQYKGQGAYSLSAAGMSGKLTVSFDEYSNLQTNVNFYEQAYCNFSGYVLYEGSSIPVSGVHFLRDGVPVIDASGKMVSTDNQGAFVVHVPNGAHSLQVVKDGHVFANDGFFIDLDSAEGDPTLHNWQNDVSGIFLWDLTTVTLQGRVVGGNDQGLLPLGESLSKNNLGDSLTMVLQLEGDNASWIVRDQLDSQVRERHFFVCHGRDGNDTTRVDAYRHRIVIHPDPITGEYQVPLYPVKFKVTEVCAKGYSTLFQSGMVSELVDLSDRHNGSVASYSRIYHAQPTLDVWQFQGSHDRFYGLKQYISRDNAGLSDTITLWRDGRYMMGHPVFMAGASVPMLLSAREEYHYNNALQGSLDVVQLDSGVVYAANGLVGAEVNDVVSLDGEGQATYVFTPQNTTFTLEDDMALRSLKFTLLYDGSYYDIEPIEGFVMAAQSKPQGRRILAGQNTHLVDILRDPPGANSSAFIEAGSKFSYAYSCDYTVNMGVNIGVGLGSGSDYYNGVCVTGVGSGTEGGIINSTDHHGTLSYDLATSYYDDWTCEYVFETTDRISTSDSEREIGAGSDLYMGMTDNIIVEDAIAVRVVNAKALERLRPGMGGTVEVGGHVMKVSGTVKVLARGLDAVTNDSIFLIRDEVLQIQSKISSTFIHSQNYLTEELIPSLIRTRNALLLDSVTAPDYAQALANARKMPVYVSRVGTDSQLFGYSYTSFYPQDMPLLWGDSIQALNTQIESWIGFIASNEREKLEAGELVNVYDFDGAASIDHAESFTTSISKHRYWSLPSSISLGDGEGVNPSGQQDAKRDEQKEKVVEYKAGGFFFSLNLTPLFGFDFNYLNGMDSTFTKQTGFSLACSRKSNLSVAVYRTRDLSADSLKSLYQTGNLGLFYRNVEENLKRIYNGRNGSSNTTSYIESLSKVPRYRNFVFRTLGGATASPWEEERRTLFYNPGTVLDQPTLQINKLRIWAKEGSVSNVPYGEPARFSIFMVNESELPDRVTHEISYYMEDAMNPKGAKIFIDGMPLTGSGVKFWMEPGVIYEKQVEVYAAAEYDYDNLGISIYDAVDPYHIWTVNLSAHFVPAAGPIHISKPGDKWVVNTESLYDGDRQAYYMPVHIDGFDVNFRNFDHIELQYKLSTQGDKDWVNICSYYPNTEAGKALMAQASGEKRLMDSDGFIDANFYGESDPIEQHYDLRAVCFCRHGSGYLTRSSNILSGIKDTRRPQPFGTPQPTNGILGIGNDICIAFSEPIAGNYLSPVNNFEVLGLTRQSSISSGTALQFDGNSAALSMSKRNLAAKDFTLDLMLRPRLNGKDLTVMSHGVDGNAKLCLGVTADGRLSVNMNGVKVQSNRPVDFSDMRHVAYVFDVDGVKNKTFFTFYEDNTIIGTDSIVGIYDGTNILVFGDGFEGEMLEVRLWNKALSKAELSSYAGKRLRGTELSLMDYYPMDEGRGGYAYDKAVGSNDLQLAGATWKVPDGISLAFDGTQSVPMNPSQFNRTDYEDYSLMMWFRTNDTDATLISNGEAKNEKGYKDHINLGFENGKLFFRSGGQQVEADGIYNDGSWHHVAVMVNRARNVGTLYVDQQLKQSFPVDTLGGILGNNLCLGATFRGNIDEVAMFEMALPENMLKLIANQTPSGTEMGLLAYLPFSQLERQLDNSQRLMPTGVSIKCYKDNHGEVVEAHRDTIIAQEIIDVMADRRSYAPMTNSGLLENIKYSYVAKDNELYVNLDVPDYQIEKTNVYVTVKEVADLQGNLMASPVAMDLYVYRNPLRWNVKRKAVEVKYGMETTIDLTIQNLSGKAKDYTLEGLPYWMTASQSSGKIDALDEQSVMLTISPYVNIGDYEEIVYIVGENGITEPLPLNIRVRGDAPEWAVDDELKRGNVTMHIVARVMMDGEIAHDEEDILAAVGTGHSILGTAKIKQTGDTADALAYLTIYNEAEANGQSVNFEFYDASSGRIHVVEKQDVTKAVADAFVADTIRFQPDAILGTPTSPVVLHARFKEVQSIRLNMGWNWVSTYVLPAEATVANLLGSIATWQESESIELTDDQKIPFVVSYKPVADTLQWDRCDSVIRIRPERMYRIYAMSPKCIYFSGENYTYSPVTLYQGWNRIGYLAAVNLPLATALADYTDAASEGDIIKSQSEFAVLSIDAHGNREWKGTLEFLRAGEGYMLKRHAAAPHTFYYPYYSAHSKYNSSLFTPHSSLFTNTSGTSMNVIASVEGVDVEQGDRLLACADGEVRGIAQCDPDGLFFLSIAQCEEKEIAFAIERQGEIVATTTPQMTYIPDGVQGSLSQPSVIRFNSSADSGVFPISAYSGWYTLQGIRLQNNRLQNYRQKGVYIHNGRKVTVK